MMTNNLWNVLQISDTHSGNEQFCMSKGDTLPNDQPYQNTNAYRDFILTMTLMHDIETALNKDNQRKLDLVGNEFGGSA